jgi:hypothetical protein
MRKELTPSRKRLKKATGDRPTVVCGFKAVQLVEVLLQGLPDAGTQRDRAGNPQLVYDQYATLLLLYFFTPTVTRLRGIQPRSELTKVQQCWGVRRTALSTRSEAATVFDATLLRDGSSKLALRAGTQVPPGHPAVGVREQDFFRDLSAIAGSLLPHCRAGCGRYGKMSRLGRPRGGSRLRRRGKCRSACRSLPITARSVPGRGSWYSPGILRLCSRLWRLRPLCRVARAAG